MTFVYAGQDHRDGDFAGCTLRRAEFHGATLAGADFTGANLRGADLRRTNLRGANVTEADTTGADFRHANLTGLVGLRDQRDVAAEVLIQHARERDVLLLAVACLLKRHPEQRGTRRSALDHAMALAESLGSSEAARVGAILREAGFA